MTFFRRNRAAMLGPRLRVRSTVKNVKNLFAKDADSKLIGDGTPILA